MMKYILTILIPVVAGSILLLPAAQDEPPKYSYHLWGNVLDQESRTMPRTTVCLVPAVRPIAGRIPCVKTDDAGDFALTVKDIPDKYKACASTKDSPFIFEGDQAKGHRAVCSEVIEFGAKDECRQIGLKFPAQQLDEAAYRHMDVLVHRQVVSGVGRSQALVISGAGSLKG